MLEQPVGKCIAKIRSTKFLEWRTNSSTRLGEHVIRKYVSSTEHIYAEGVRNNFFENSKETQRKLNDRK
jgi:hypothetical protein